MKLLGWMHHKFRLTSNDPLQDFAIEFNHPSLTAQPPLHGQCYYSKPTYGRNPHRQTEKDYHRKSLCGLERTQEEEEEASEAMSELFHSFLAIGTLGSEHIASAPSTPTFTISLDDKTRNETEFTEKELKFLNDNLEKTLGAESSDTSRRNSHVSNGRSSNGSTITLSGKALEIPEATKNENMVCPLQGYLFGSMIELSETTETARKEQRTSLKDLFQKTKIEEQNPGGRFDKEEKKTRKDMDKSVVDIVKNILKKKVKRVTRSSTTAFGRIDNSASAETKLNKIVQIFHRKVHHEELTGSKKHVKFLENEKKNRIVSFDGAHNYEGDIIPNGPAIPQNANPDINIGSYKSPSNHHFTLSSDSDNDIGSYKSKSNHQSTLSNDSNGNRELWIKTDANYLVLEL